MGFEEPKDYDRFVCRHVEFPRFLAGQVLYADGSDYNPADGPGFYWRDEDNTKWLRFGGNNLYLRHQETSGTHGGSSTSGSYQTRTLNTEVYDGIGSTLSSNQFTLPAGTYQIRARAPARGGSGVTIHKAKLYNITDSADVIIGSVTASGASATSDSVIQGRL